MYRLFHLNETEEALVIDIEKYYENMILSMGAAERVKYDGNHYEENDIIKGYVQKSYCQFW